MQIETLFAPPASEVALIFRALADETRVQILRLLAPGDLRAGELGARLALPQNAISYHLRQLRSLGVLRDHRSSGDARDVYYSLDHERLDDLLVAAGAMLRPQAASQAGAGEGRQPLSVLFLCTHNSARSQLAEGIMRYLGGEQVQVWSAGSDPAAAVHPEALAILAGLGLATACYEPRSLDQFVGRAFDYVITVCDSVRDNCPVFPGDPLHIHWSFPDPAAIADAAARQRAFAEIRQGLFNRVRYLLLLPRPTGGPGKREE